MPIIAGQERTQLDGHRWHILVLVAWMPIFALLLLCENARQRRGKPRRATGTDTTVRSRQGRDVRPRGAMAVASACAALPHAAVTADHFRGSLW